MKQSVAAELLLALLLGGALTACSKASVEGSFFLTYGAGDVKPAAGAEISLVSGNLTKEVCQKLVERAKISMVSKLEERKRSLSAELARLGYAVTASKDDCSAEQRTYDQAEVDFRSARQPVDEKLSVLDKKKQEISADQRDLSETIATARSQKMKTLKEDYISKHVVVRSYTSPSGLYDDKPVLCISVTNTGNLNVESARLTPYYKGMLVAYDVVENIWHDWGFASRSWEQTGFELKWDCDSSLGLQFCDKSDTDDGPDVEFWTGVNQYGEILSGLAPGDSKSYCYVWYPEQHLDSNLARRFEAYFGTTNARDVAYRPWSLALTGMRITDGERRKNSEGRWQFVDRPLEKVFRTELGAFGRGLKETDKLRKVNQEVASLDDEIASYKDALSELPDRQRLSLAKENLATCEGNMRTRDALGRVDEDLAVLSGDKPEGAALNQRIVAEANNGYSPKQELAAYIAKNTVATARTTIDGHYSFGELKTGTYTLVAEYETALSVTASWVVVVNASGTTEIDLANYNMSKSSVDEHVLRVCRGYF